MPQPKHFLPRSVFILLAIFCGLSLRAAPPQATSNHDATRADFDQLMKELSNWGRWGKDDQVGAVNLITPAKRKDALRTVKDGVSVSMARKAEIEPALDNPRPITRADFLVTASPVAVPGATGSVLNPIATF